MLIRKEVKPSSWTLALLILSISLSVAAALYPYSLAVNPEGRGFGVDVHYYVDNGEIVERDVSQAFNVMSGSRPLIFLVIYGFQKLLGSDVSTAVRFLPVILNPLMVVGAFFLAFEAFGDWRLSSWSAFFTACGYQVTVGMYSYFLTNMLALSLVFLSLGFLFRSLRRCCNISLALASILGILLVFTHPWTFDQYVVTMILTIIIYFYRIRRENGWYEKINGAIIYVVFLGFSDFAKKLLFQGAGAFSASLTAVRGISNFSEFWMDFISSFRLLYGGTISVIVLIGLAVLGVYLNDLGEFSEIYFTVFPVATSLLFLIDNGAIKSRLLYNVPIGLFAAIGMSSLSRWKFDDNFKKCFILFVILNLTVYLFRSLANLV